MAIETNSGGFELIFSGIPTKANNAQNIRNPAKID